MEQNIVKDVFLNQWKYFGEIFKYCWSFRFWYKYVCILSNWDIFGATWYIQHSEHYKATRYFISLTATLINLAYFRKKLANDKVDLMNRIQLSWYNDP